MQIAILDLIPYIAYAGAAVLILWVVGEVVLSKMRRKAKPTLAEPKDSGRGLAGPPEPLSAESRAMMAARAPVSTDEEETAPEPVIADVRISTEDDTAEEPEQEPTEADQPEVVYDDDDDQIDSARFPLPLVRPEPEPTPIPVPELSADSDSDSVDDSETDIPSSMVASFDDDSSDVVYNKPSDTVRSEAVDGEDAQENESTNIDQAGDPAAEQMVYSDVLSVQRDPSVRVYDTAVAASERKSASS